MPRKDGKPSAPRKDTLPAEPLVSWLTPIIEAEGTSWVAKRVGVDEAAIRRLTRQQRVTLAKADRITLRLGGGPYVLNALYPVED
jgi:hypothetical protein